MKRDRYGRQCNDVPGSVGIVYVLDIWRVV